MIMLQIKNAIIYFYLKQFLFLFLMLFQLNSCLAAPTIPNNFTETPTKYENSITNYEYEISTTTPKTTIEISTLRNAIETATPTPSLTEVPRNNNNNLKDDIYPKLPIDEEEEEKITTKIIVNPTSANLLTLTSTSIKELSLTTATTAENILRKTETLKTPKINQNITKPSNLEKFKKYPKNRPKKLKEKNLKYHQSSNNPILQIPSTTESIRTISLTENVHNINEKFFEEERTTIGITNLLTTTADNDAIIQSTKEISLKKSNNNDIVQTSTENNGKNFDFIINKNESTDKNRTKDDRTIGLSSSTTIQIEVSTILPTIVTSVQSDDGKINSKESVDDDDAVHNVDGIKNLAETTFANIVVTQKPLKTMTSNPQSKEHIESSEYTHFAMDIKTKDDEDDDAIKKSDKLQNKELLIRHSLKIKDIKNQKIDDRINPIIDTKIFSTTSEINSGYLDENLKNMEDIGEMPINSSLLTTEIGISSTSFKEMTTFEDTTISLLDQNLANISFNNPVVNKSKTIFTNKTSPPTESLIMPTLPCISTTEKVESSLTSTVTKNEIKITPTERLSNVNTITNYSQTEPPFQDIKNLAPVSPSYHQGFTDNPKITKQNSTELENQNFEHVSTLSTTSKLKSQIESQTKFIEITTSASLTTESSNSSSIHTEKPTTIEPITNILTTTVIGKSLEIVDMEKNNSKEAIKNLQKNELSDFLISNKTTAVLTSENVKLNSDNGTQMGHDGVKITKKKQLLEKHYKIDDVDDENDDNEKNENDKIKGHLLGPIVMKEKVLINKEISKELFTTSRSTTNDKFIELNTDIVSKDDIQEKNLKTVPVKTTVDPLVEHRIFEQSLISQMEWVPITNVEHVARPNGGHTTPASIAMKQASHTTLGSIAMKKAKVSFSKSDSTAKVQSTTDNINDSKSLEIELIDGSDDTSTTIVSSERRAKQQETVPEFFEITHIIKKPNRSDTDSSPIEIQINVSEGFGNENENLEFSFRQPTDRQTAAPVPKYNKQSHILPGFQEIGEITIQRSSELVSIRPQILPTKSNEPNDEVLEVEITAIDNSTDQNDNFNPKFTVHSESQPHENDDIFVPDLKLEQIEDSVKREESSADRDSDTIFYISNTEVKVVESAPTSTQSALSKLESNYFPAEYKAFNKNRSHPNEKKIPQFEEDIILSPIKNNYDSIKNEKYDAHSQAADVSYVGETFIEIEESTNPSTTTTKKDTDLPLIMHSMDSENSSGALLSDVIIQPAVIPEMSIGVPVIGELPPQIELKDLDYLASKGKFSDGTPGLTAAESSIQYGGDLVDDGAQRNAGRYIFESGYPFGDEKVNRVGRVHNFDSDEGEDDDENDDDVSSVKSQIIMHAVNNLQKENFLADVGENDGFKVISSKNDDAKPDLINYIQFVNSTGNATNSTEPEKLGNATAYSILDEAEQEFSLTDVQTLLIACAATLVPLILSLLLAFGVRYLWKKYRHDSDDDDDDEGGGLVNADQIGVKSTAISQDELRTTESGYTLNRSNDTLDTNADYGGGGGGGSIGSHTNLRHNSGGGGCGNFDGFLSPTNGNNNIMANHSGANGSVITMTLKNNHLIVETEERNDISRDARETKINYNSSDKDGVFVVEVARGADCATNATVPGSPRSDACKIDLDNKSVVQINDENKEQVQIHQPPSNEKVQEEIQNFKEKPLSSTNTGLSQSDLSSSSIESNKGYTYGNQTLYSTDKNGYSPPTPRVIFSPPQQNTDNNNKKEESDNENDCDDDANCNGNCEKELENGQEHNNVTEEDNTNVGGDIKEVTSTKSSSTTSTKPIITGGLLKQDTVIEITGKKSTVSDDNSSLSTETLPSVELNNGSSNKNDENFLQPTLSPTLSSSPANSGDGDKLNIEEINGHNKNIEEITSISPSPLSAKIQNSQMMNGHLNQINEIENINGDANGCIQINSSENGFDSILSLPEPPSNDEIKQMNDICIIDNSLDSLPPPPPPTILTNFIENNNNEIHSDANGKITTPPTTTTTTATTTNLNILKNGSCDNGTAVAVTGSS